jgi:uncharacterized damage-inducible protein DinB
MIKPTKWIDRKFNFDFPLGLYPSILERLRYTPMRIKQFVIGLDEKTLSYKPDSKWSIKEHIGHIAIVEPLWEKRLEQFLAAAETLISADMSNQKTVDENFNQWQIDKLISHLTQTRSAFMAKLENLTESEIGITALHPRLKKPMRLIDMTYFIAEHDDNELALMRSKLT